MHPSDRRRALCAAITNACPCGPSHLCPEPIVRGLDMPAIDVSRFEIAEMLRSGRKLREIAQHAASLQEAAQDIVRVLYDACVDPDTGARTCVLVRFYKTHDFGTLPPDIQAFAARKLGTAKPRSTMRTLVLLASAGDEPAWNDVTRSKEHRAIPLASQAMVRDAPMIARLFHQFGLRLREIVQPTSQSPPERPGRTYDVFHIEHAPGSRHIPAQADFVDRYGIRSVVGFGGELRSGHPFATILFSRVRIPAESAKRFRPLAVEIKAGLFFMDEGRTFAR